MTVMPPSPRSLRAALERTTRTPGHERYILRLYITGLTARSSRAVNNLRAICDEYLDGRYDLEVIDILEHPDKARGDQIVAIPTLVIKLPHAVRKIIGDLSDADKVLVGLALQEVV